MDSSTKFSTKIIQTVPAAIARKNLIFPFDYEDDYLHVYIESKESFALLKDELEVILGKKIRGFEIKSEDLNRLIGTYYPKNLESDDIVSKNQPNRVNFRDDFFDKIVQESLDLNCSDIHIECYKSNCRIRVRIHGVLVEKYILNKNDYPALINKIKIKSNLDISEKRLPQDGRIQHIGKGQKLDIRVSIIPTLYGEKIVLRLLTKDSSLIDVNNLGLTDLQFEHFNNSILKSNGIVLISGPTGSGKTTTLYATLSKLNEEKRNIVTIEDPIEYTLEGINQVQINESISLDFSKALKAFLRQDPDVIMLGEIRDPETALMAIRAALTGHLVLSTIHTNSAWGTISRLKDMGVPSYLISSTINATIAQRLVRILCEDCKTKDNNHYNLKTNAEIANKDLYHSSGCEKCNYTGFVGRQAIYEIIPLNDIFVNAVKNNRDEVHELLKEQKIETLKEKALDLLLQGKTSLDEIYYLLM